MKKLLFILLLVSTTVFAISCGKKDEGTTTSNTNFLPTVNP